MVRFPPWPSYSYVYLCYVRKCPFRNACLLVVTAYFPPLRRAWCLSFGERGIVSRRKQHVLLNIYIETNIRKPMRMQHLLLTMTAWFKKRKPVVFKMLPNDSNFKFSTSSNSCQEERCDFFFIRDVEYEDNKDNISLIYETLKPVLKMGWIGLQVNKYFQTIPFGTLVPSTSFPFISC